MIFKTLWNKCSKLFKQTHTQKYYSFFFIFMNNLVIFTQLLVLNGISVPVVGISVVVSVVLLLLRNGKCCE